MRAPAILIAFLAASAIGLTGCSAHGRLRPVNSINEPVFSPSQYTTLGLGFGRAWVHGGDGLDTVGRIIYANRFFAWDVPVSSWAGFNLLPVHWTFLLTGEQYSDSLSLQTRKLHATVFGGINGFYYSQKDEWSFPADLGVRSKYLVSEDEFVVSQAGIDFFHFLKPEYNTPYLSFGYGWQLTQGNSLELDYHVFYFNLPENAYLYNVIKHRDGDTNAELMLHHYFFYRGRHVIGPEIGWGMKNLEIGQNDYYKAGLNYRYVFR